MDYPPPTSKTSTASQQGNCCCGKSGIAPGVFEISSSLRWCLDGKQLWYHLFCNSSLPSGFQTGWCVHGQGLWVIWHLLWSDIRKGCKTGICIHISGITLEFFQLRSKCQVYFWQRHLPQGEVPACPRAGTRSISEPLGSFHPGSDRAQGFHCSLSVPSAGFFGK